MTKATAFVDISFSPFYWRKLIVKADHERGAIQERNNDRVV